jgi:D-tagatose-1,6-bisphosphate aldolase subunit GatZ/KbaZ
LFALAAIENEVVPAGERSDLPATVERQMLAEPGHWEQHYRTTPEGDALARRYSYSDRMRYYWADHRVDAAVRTLLENRSARTIPEPLLSAFLPDQYHRVRAGHQNRPGSCGELRRRDRGWTRWRWQWEAPMRCPAGRLRWTST